MDRVCTYGFKFLFGNVFTFPEKGYLDFLERDEIVEKGRIARKVTAFFQGKPELSVGLNNYAVFHLIIFEMLELRG